LRKPAKNDIIQSVVVDLPPPTILGVIVGLFFKKMQKKIPLLVQLNPEEREKIELLAATWGNSLAAAVRRIIREYPL
jgi:hypothetical protein